MLLPAIHIIILKRDTDLSIADHMETIHTEGKMVLPTMAFMADPATDNTTTNRTLQTSNMETIEEADTKQAGITTTFQTSIPILAAASIIADSGWTVLRIGSWGAR